MKAGTDNSAMPGQSLLLPEACPSAAPARKSLRVSKGKDTLTPLLAWQSVFGASYFVSVSIQAEKQ